MRIVRGAKIKYHAGHVTEQRRWRLEYDNRELQRLINILAGVSLLTIVLKTALADVPQLFPGGEKIGTILWEFSLAYLSAWIFNLLVVVLPKRADKRDIYRIVEPLMHSAAGWGFLTMLFAVTEEHYIPGRPDREALKRACAKMNPNDQARSGIKKDRQGRLVPITWMEYGEQDMERSAEALRDLQAFYPYLDAEAIALLDEVRSHFVRITFKDAEFLGRSGDADFSKYESYFYDYWVLTNRLFQYKIEKIAPLARGMA